MYVTNPFCTFWNAFFKSTFLLISLCLWVCFRIFLFFLKLLNEKKLYLQDFKGTIPTLFSSENYIDKIHVLIVNYPKIYKSC